MVLAMTNNDTPPFKIGDLVTSDFYRKDAAVVRRVTEVRRAPHPTQTDWLVAADAGAGCPTCGVNSARSIYAVDSAWFKHCHQPGGDRV